MKKIIFTVASLLISVIAFLLVLRDVSWDQLLETMSQADILLLLTAFVSGLVAMLVRAFRWRFLLPNGKEIRFKQLYTGMTLSYFINNLVPARLGELARAELINRKYGNSRISVISGIVFEKLGDTLLLFATLLLASLLIAIPGEYTRIASLMILVIMVLLFISWILYKSGFFIFAYRLLADNLRNHINKAFTEIRKGFLAIREKQQIKMYVVLTLIVFGFEYLGNCFILAAFIGYFDFAATIVLLAFISLSFVIPSAPGALGVMEYLIVAALSLFFESHETNVSVALTIRAMFLLSTSLQGMLSIILEGIDLNRMIKAVRVKKEELNSQG